nr:hypothetical protein [Kovacikia minuta]
MKLRLTQYPGAIAQAAQAVNEIDSQIAEIRQRLARLEGNADLIVAFETALKNDNQRKARRYQVLQQDATYEQMLDHLNNLSTQKANALAQLERLRNEFTVAKLEVQLAIAQKLASSETRELVGL